MWQKITVIELENHMFIALGNKIQAKQTEEKVYHVILLSGKAPAVTCRAIKFFSVQRKQEKIMLPDN